MLEPDALRTSAHGEVTAGVDDEVLVRPRRECVDHEVDEAALAERADVEDARARAGRARVVDQVRRLAPRAARPTLRGR